MTIPKQQHSLPRFLLKGFPARVSGKDVYTYQFRDDTIPSEPTNIKKIGKSQRFYGAGGKGTLDDEIGRRETDFAVLVDDLRQGARMIGRDRRIAALAAHLVIRTRHLRQAVATELPSYIEQLAHSWLNPDKQQALERALERRLQRDPIHSESFAATPLPLRQALVRRFVREFRSDQLEKITAALNVLDADAQAAAAHVRALVTHHNSTLRVDHFDALEWAVVDVANGPLTLGDLGPIARFNQLQFQHPVKYARPPTEMALPISSSLAVVGTAGCASTAFPIDCDTINVEIVELSREFFICSQSTDRERRYATLLGRRRELMDVNEVRAALDRGFEEFCRDL